MMEGSTDGDASPGIATGGLVGRKVRRGKRAAVKVAPTAGVDGGVPADAGTPEDDDRKVQTTLSLSVRQRRYLTRHAGETGLTWSDIVGALIEEHVQRYRVAPIPRKGGEPGDQETLRVA